MSFEPVLNKNTGLIKYLARPSSNLLYHSTEMKCLCLMKCSSNMLQNLPYSQNKKNPFVFFCFSFHFMLYFIFPYLMPYVEIFRIPKNRCISLEHFMTHKYLIYIVSYEWIILIAAFMSSYGHWTNLKKRWKKGCVIISILIIPFSSKKLINI